MGLSIYTPAAADPVSLTEAKLHLRVEHSTEDELIRGLIAAATKHAERITGRSLVNRTYKYTLDYFPDDVICLPNPPLYTTAPITSVKYYANGVLTTVDAATYRVLSNQEPGEIVLVYGEVWPVADDIYDAIEIQYVAGYGTANSVPADIKAAMKLMIGSWYKNRDESDPTQDVPSAATMLLQGNWSGLYMGVE